MAGAANTDYIDWIYVNCSKTASTARASGSCPFTVPATLAAGSYELRLLANDDFMLLATSNTCYFPTAEHQSIDGHDREYRDGNLEWILPSPTATDWIGLYRAGAANTDYIDWMYVNCSKTASTARASGSCPFTVPATLAAGSYELRLLANDDFMLLATSNLVISPPLSSMLRSCQQPSRNLEWCKPTALTWIRLYGVHANTGTLIGRMSLGLNR